ncbi:PadR family transcriptional regulator [Streptomyces olivoreticuli]
MEQGPGRQRRPAHQPLPRDQPAGGRGPDSGGDTERGERYPERTVYRVTDAGRAATRQWLAEILAAPRNEFPEFPAALSFVLMLPPETALALLTERRERLQEQITALDTDLATQAGEHRLPRVALLETEYVRAVTHAELQWVTAVTAELADGSFTWNRQELEALASGAHTPDGTGSE